MLQSTFVIISESDPAVSDHIELMKMLTCSFGLLAAAFVCQVMQLQGTAPPDKKSAVREQMAVMEAVISTALSHPNIVQVSILVCHTHSA